MTNAPQKLLAHQDLLCGPCGGVPGAEGSFKDSGGESASGL